MILYCNHIAWHFRIHQNRENLPWLLLLHGFMGSGEVFTPMLDNLKQFCNPVTVDLPGHGRSGGGPNSERYRTGKLVESLHTLISRLSLNPLFLHGYSMGGRLALQYIVAHQKEIEGVILESSTAGIREETLRQDRRNADEERACQILADFPLFLDQWLHQSLFLSSQGSRYHRDLYHRVIREQDPRTMAAFLRGFGTGSMPSQYHRLEEVMVPVLLLAGANDEKYRAISAEMDRKLYNSTLRILPECGHRVHLDQPGQWVTEIKTYIQQHQHEPENI